MQVDEGLMFVIINRSYYLLFTECKVESIYEVYT